MEKMQTGILVSVAAVSVAAGFLAGAVAFGGNKREMPDGPVSTKVRRYFDEAACRRGAAFLDEKLQASRSPGEMAGLGVAATAGGAVRLHRELSGKAAGGGAVRCVGR